jgi:hypothetical protein
MSDDSALSSTPSEECIIEKFVSQFHDDYTNAVDEVRYPYFVCVESTSAKKKLTLHLIFFSWRMLMNRMDPSTIPTTVTQPWRQHESV